ncbi:MAG: low molecular weight phosphatase family protein, partial [Candidatus Bipolaricaulota bacterium]
AQVMQEIGIDISEQRPKGITPEEMMGYNYIITMGCGAEGACPVAFGGTVADWGLPDPTEADLDQYRHIRDTIREHVQELLRQVKADELGG